MMTSEHIGEIAVALSRVQSKLKPLKRNASNSEFGSKYTDFATVKLATKNLLFHHGLAVVQVASSSMPESGFWSATVTTRLIHVSGQWIQGEPLSFPSMAATPHGLASALTFAKRYAFCAILGIVSETEDDDGNTAAGKRKGKAKHFKRTRKNLAVEVELEPATSVEAPY
jgi:hypothetical protein